MITQICLDIDGVLADWESGVCKLFNADPEKVQARRKPGDYKLAPYLGVSDNAMWRAIDAAGEAFWVSLEPYPWCFELWELCNAMAPTTLCTSPSEHPSSMAGKLLWMQEHFGGRKMRDFLVGPPKHFCARPGAVLIDDRDQNCSEFIVDETGVPTGATSILFPQPWNELYGFCTDRLGFVRDALTTQVMI